jgi:hypothetical protein
MSSLYSSRQNYNTGDHRPEETDYEEPTIDLCNVCGATFTAADASKLDRHRQMCLTRAALDRAAAKQRTISRDQWVPDSQRPKCCLCTVKFGARKRRHHCRACGEVICGSCSRWHAKPGEKEGLKSKQQRICARCNGDLGSFVSSSPRAARV